MYIVMHTSHVHLGTCVCAPGTHRYFMYRLTHLGTHVHIDIHWFILVKHSPELFWKESSRTSTVCYILSLPGSISPSVPLVRDQTVLF